MLKRRLTRCSGEGSQACALNAVRRMIAERPGRQPRVIMEHERDSSYGRLIYRLSMALPDLASDGKE